MEKNKRLLSLDILRGMTVAGMILVNNGYGESFWMLRHSRWNGLTPCDLVFPFFLFIMGISCYLSLQKSHFRPSAHVLWRVLKRTVLLFAIGLAINWLDHAIEGDVWCFDHLRVWAVMQRIALCYLLVSLFALYVPHRLLIPTIMGLLLAYTALLLVGHGYDENAQTNILARIDLSLFGEAHLYHKSPVDPEGLAGTISSTAHVLIGFYCGRLLQQALPLQQRIAQLFAVGTLLAMMGWLLSFGLPLNKRVWSPSYALITCGMAALLLALLLYWEQKATDTASGRHVSDVASGVSQSVFFTVFGVNALALYVLSEGVAIVFGHFAVSDALYALLHGIIPWARLASLAYAVTFVLICYVLGYVLYRKRIYIKL